MALPEKYKSPYDASLVEESIYKKETESGFFTPENLVKAYPSRYEKSEAWTTITPPPNANGHLHAGHALDVTLKDVIGRFHRMNNKRVLMIPGSDHAGFETQVVYEKKLEKEGRSRFGMDRDLLYKEIYDFTIANKDTVAGEVKRIGASYDWSRDTFTLDAKVVTGVQDTFIKMYNDGLIYRSKRDVNWCSKHQTSLSDLETTNKEMTDTFYTFKIGEFLIGTSRPETKFGDKYIVVHPEDARYSKYTQGDTFEAEWILGPTKFTIIKDESIDMEFGTGAMTITPWHSGIDFQIAKKYNLDMVQVIDENGKLMDIAGELKGLRAITEGRKRTVEILEQKGLLVEKNEKYTHVVPVCYKCETPIEPQLKDQWFVKMAPLAEKALEASTKGEIDFVTDQFRKTYEYWMSNPIDWNISRQIVWGIRIPAWFKNKGTDTEEYYIGHDNPGGEWIQDIDTFDTWFSSGQWPVATLGFVGADDFKTYYPTQLMETGRDLIFKWVPRMVIFGLYLTDYKQVPFKDIYLHGMVLDPKGQKMSKSKGNVMSPIELADEFGMDALRMALVVGTTPGSDQSMSKDKVRAYKKFVNKLWNISRFVLENTDNENEWDKSIIDNEYINKLENVKMNIGLYIEKYQLHLASEELYHYVWHEFADVVIEDVKKDLTDANKAMLRYMLKEILTMAHPFMPFVTEEIWSDVRNDGEVELLLVKEW
ncbi:MAG: valine--tRNA ligase [Patescibacteria group bacterium]